MIFFNLKEQLNFYINEPDKRIREKFFSNVLYDVLNALFKFSLKKCGVFEHDPLYDDLKQELHLLVITKVEKIIKAKDSNDYIFIMCKNHIINKLKWQKIHFMPAHPGETLELIN